MIPVSKGQKAVRACTIRLLNLGHAKYEVQNIQWMFVLHRSKRILERIVEVRRTEQSVGSILYYFYTKT